MNLSYKFLIMGSNIIFLSHIQEEEEIVFEFRDMMNKIFGDTINFYLFQKNEAGVDMVNAITDNLNASQIIVIFCSAESISKPWINFEIGFSSKMKKDDNQKIIIPILCFNLKKEQLPSYLSNLIYVQLDLDNKVFQKKILQLIFIFAKISAEGMIFNFDLENLESYINDFHQKYVHIHEKYQSLIKLKNEMYEKVNKRLNEYMFHEDKLLLRKEAELLQNIENKLSINFITTDDKNLDINYFDSSKTGYITSINLIDFDVLPKELMDFKYLIKLKINKFHNSTLPDWIGSIKKLEYLKVKDSDIESLPDSIQNLNKLKELWLYGNEKLEFLPDAIGELSNLRHLNLSHSNVKKIPENFEKLTNLQELYIAWTKVDTIPEWISKLTKLKELSGSFQIIPESFGNLANLEKLNTGIIENLPKSFLCLKKLNRGVIYIDPDQELEPDMKDFLEELKGKGCLVVCTEEDFNNLYIERITARELIRRRRRNKIKDDIN